MVTACLRIALRVAASHCSQVQGHASSNSYWISYSTCAADSAGAPSGIAGPDGKWWSRCAPGQAAAITVVDIDPEHENVARTWRRTARSGQHPVAIHETDPL
jgi:hypothetical protein